MKKTYTANLEVDHNKDSLLEACGYKDAEEWGSELLAFLVYANTHITENNSLTQVFFEEGPKVIPQFDRFTTHMALHGFANILEDMKSEIQNGITEAVNRIGEKK
jgi:hypothetical protein